MAQKGTGPKRRGEPTLTAADWAEAALQVIADRGLAALTVDALAARLGVSKGSFYWHFRRRSELVSAALERWERRSTAETIKALDGVTDARQRLALILDASSQLPRSRSLYAALAEAAHDPVVEPVLSRVATARIGYLETCYRELGLPQPEAQAKALFAYAAYRGLLQLAYEVGAAVLPAEWSSYPHVVREALLPSLTAVPASKRPKGRRSAPGRSGTQLGRKRSTR